MYYVASFDGLMSPTTFVKSEFNVYGGTSKGRGKFPGAGFGENESIYCNSFRWMGHTFQSKFPRASESEGHFEHIDNKFSKLILCNFQSEDFETKISSAEHAKSRIDFPKPRRKVDFQYHVWMRTLNIMWPQGLLLR